MTNLIKFTLGSALTAALLAQPSLAQTAGKPALTGAATAPRGTAVVGVGVADLQAAVASTNAYRAAVQKRQVDYKPIYDAAQARLVQLQTQVKPLADQFNADRAAKKPDAVLQTEYNQIQAMQAQAEAEIGRTPAPRVSPFADAQDGAQLLQRAGFALPVADSDVVTVRYANIFGLFRDLKAIMCACSCRLMS